MSKRIFRQVALERLSSPERLDEAMAITGPKEWIGLLGLVLLLAAGVAWVFLARVPTVASADGVILRHGGILNIVGAGAGLLVEIQVRPGDHVQAGQVVAQIAQPALLERIRVTEAAIVELRNSRERNLRVRSTGARLQVEAIDRQKANAEAEIRTLEQQAKLTRDQVVVDEQLHVRGFITRQQSLLSKEKLAQIEGRIDAARAQLKQLDAQQFSTEQQPKETDFDFQARLTELERTLGGLRQEFASSTRIVAPAAGQVLELKANRGAAVTPGTPIVSMQLETESIEALVYIPATMAKDVRPGMEARVSPGTVKREEFGYLVGRVSFVADYPASPAAMMRSLENESLAQRLSGAGPVTEIRLALEKAETPSGFRWSSRQGPPLRITSGTLCAALLVTRFDRPIDLYLPWVSAGGGH